MIGNMGIIPIAIFGRESFTWARNKKCAIKGVRRLKDGDAPTTVLK